MGCQLGNQRSAVGIGQGLPHASAVLALEAVANHQLALACAAGHAALRIELHVHETVGLGVFPGLADAHGFARLVLDHRGVGASGRSNPDRLEVTQQGVRVATDDHVHIGQLRGDLLVVVVAQVRHQHDVAHALGLEIVDGLLGRFRFVLELGGGQRARRVGRFGGNGHAHDAHVHAVDLLDGVGLQVGGGAGRGQRRAGLRHDVGRHGGRLAVAAVGRVGQGIQEALEDAVTIVKLVVAGHEGVKADAVHHLRIGLALEEGVVQRARDGVARMQLEQVGRAGKRLEHRRLARKTTQLNLRGHAVERQLGAGKRIELRVVVVDVRDVEFDGLEAGGIVTAAAGHQAQGECAHQGQGQRTAGQRKRGVQVHGRPSVM